MATIDRNPSAINTNIPGARVLEEASQPGQTQAAQAAKGVTANQDSFALTSAEAQLSTAPQGLGAVVAPSVQLQGETLLGAESFAAQLGAMNGSDDIMAEFLKLGVGNDRQEFDSQISISEAQSQIRKYLLDAAAALISSGSGNLAYYCHQMSEQLSAEKASQESNYSQRVQEQIREGLEGQMDGKEEKSVDDKKREAQVKRKGSTQAVVAGADGAQEMSTMQALFADTPGANRLVPGILAMELGGAAGEPSLSAEGKFFQAQEQVGQHVAALAERTQSLAAARL